MSMGGSTCCDNAMFVLRIKNLKVSTFLGVYDWEKQARRAVVLNIEAHLDDTGAGQSDAMKDSVDYAVIEEQVIARLEAGSYNLIEKLVTDVGNMLLELDRRISRVTVEADKPGALRQAESVSVSVTLSRPAS
jgi:FolB domain-containing protein